MMGVDFMREQAELYRKLAADATDASLRKALIELSDTYERIAHRLASVAPRAG